MKPLRLRGVCPAAARVRLVAPEAGSGAHYILERALRSQTRSPPSRGLQGVSQIGLLMTQRKSFSASFAWLPSACVRCSGRTQISTW